MTALFVVAVSVATAGLWLVLDYNRLVTLRNRASAAYADIDVQLRRRSTLIPRLVETVKAYAAHERAVLSEIAAARAAGREEAPPPARAQAEARVEGALHDLVALAESYPDLKADQRFAELTDELVATENKLAFSRQLYNDTVNAYRDKAQSLPTVWWASSMGFRNLELFAAGNPERAPAEVRLGPPDGT